MSFRKTVWAVRLATAGLILCCGCATIYTARGAYHRVQPGETLAIIAARYHADLQEMAELNNIQSGEDLRAGRSIFIPHVRLGHRRFAAHLKKGKGKKEEKVLVTTIRTEHGKFLWPVQGEISSLYGVRHGRRHDGLDIRAHRGTPIKAAADGEVVFAKRMHGYGNLVILKHPDDFFTVYAHNSVNLVKKGRKVKKGQTLAKVGSTGRATGPHLHFEVREGSHSHNPLFYLPETLYAKKAREEVNHDEEVDHGGTEETHP